MAKKIWILYEVGSSDPLLSEVEAETRSGAIAAGSAYFGVKADRLNAVPKDGPTSRRARQAAANRSRSR